MIRSTLAYLFVSLYLLVLSPIAMLWVVATRNAHIYFALGRFCIRVAGLITGVRVRVIGREKIRQGETYVFLSNHQSNCDIPVLTHVLPWDYRSLLKKELMRLPVLSTVLRHAQFVAVDRRDPNQSRASIDRAAELLRGGHSFISFPEGTRSRDGRLGEFKKGVFIMAIRAKRPVAPITLRNSSRIQPPGTYRIRPGIVDVTIHDPIPTDQMTVEDRDHLMNQTRDLIASAL